MTAAFLHHVDVRLRGLEPKLRSVRWQFGVVAATSAAVTLAFALLPSLPFGYRAPSLHVALETSAALVALLAAFLVFGRLQREPRVADVPLACGLAVLALSNFSFRAVPAVAGESSNRVVVWAAVGGRLLGALLLAAAAKESLGQVANVRRTALGGALGSAAVVAAVGITAWLLHYHLPAAPALGAGFDASAGHPDLVVEPAFSAIQLVAGVFYAIAAFGFASRAMRRNDDFFHWLALACVLSVFSRINYFLYPSSYTDWVYLGDAFRLGFFALLLVAALREITTYWRIAAAAAALNERRRLARDLHDGLAQEVAFLRSNVGSVKDTGNDPALTERLVAAAQRAEQESRQLLAALAAPTEETFDVVFADFIGEVAARERVQIDLDVAADLRVDHLRAEALLRIAAEAVTNAARHAAVDAVWVSVEQSNARVRLRVIDNGRGFDPEAPLVAQAGHGFGLASMRGRARAVGAEFSLSSQPGQGTRVEVAV